MAEEKKKAKIDLKARLGKTQTGMTAVPLPVPGPSPSSQPSVPAPPSSDGGAPAPATSTPMPSVRPSAGIAPPPGLTAGISPGIPLPPFAQQPRQQREAPQKQTAAQQTIKVEVGEEIHEERKKAGRRTALYAVLTFLVGLGVGVPVGLQVEAGSRGTAAVAGAALIEKDVKAANLVLKDLSDKIDEGYAKLLKREYPEDLAAALGGLNVPFEAGNLENRQVGNLNAKLQRALLKYTSDVQGLNADKDAIKNMLSGYQPAVKKAWDDDKAKLIGFSVTFRGTNKDQIKLDGDWAKTYPILKQEGKKSVDKKANRWEKGDLTGSDPVVIPLDPSSASNFALDMTADPPTPTGQLKAGQLIARLHEQIDILKGKNKDTPQETAGLLKEAEDLANQLHDIGLKKK